MTMLLTIKIFKMFLYLSQEPRGKYTLLDQSQGGHLLVHHTSTYDTYKKYICKTEHKLTGIRRRSLQPARLILTGKTKKACHVIVYLTNSHNKNKVENPKYSITS